MKKLTALTITSLMGLSLTTCANAQGDMAMSTNKNIQSNEITVNVNFGEQDYITVQMMPYKNVLADLDKASVPGDLVSYTNDFSTDKNGEATFTVELSDTDDYRLYFSTMNGEKIYEEYVYFISYEDYSENVIGKLNKALEDNDKDEFYSVISKNLKAFEFENTVDADIKKAADIFFEDSKDGLSTVEYEKNANRFSVSAAIAALNESSADNVFDLVIGELNSDEDMAEYVQKHIRTLEAQEYFTDKLSGKDIDDLEEFMDEAKEALILTAVKYPDGNMNIKEIFDEYKEVLGLSSVSSKESVYRNLAGEDFDSISELVDEYKSLAKDSGSSSSGSGGSGGGNKNITTGSGVSNMIVQSGASQNNNTLSMLFEDLDSVEWAYTSISKLHELGIVNGYSEKLFRPNYSVKREEFIKMLVLAMDLDVENSVSGAFSDAEGSWCDKYVSAAKAAGLTNGIGNNMFGVGQEITRQDMAVMVYNALVMCGFENKGAENSFNDKEFCAAYASGAVAELANIGIINGVGDNNFDFVGTSTRAQAAVIIERALKLF